MSSPKRKGSLHPRDRDNYPDDRSHRSRDNDPTRPRHFPVQEQPMTTSVVPYMSGYHGYGPSESQDVPTRRAMPARTAFILIDFDDFETCARLVKQHPNVLQEDIMGLQQSAIKSYREGDADTAERCLQRAVLINYCRRVPQDQVLNYIVSLRQRGSNRADFQETYDRFKEEVKQRARVQEAPNSLVRRSSVTPSPYQPDIAQQMHGLTLQPQQSRRTSTYQNPDSNTRAPIVRHLSGGEASRGPRSAHPYIEEREPESEAEPGYQIIRNAGGNPTAAGPTKIQVRGTQTSSLNASYKVRERPEDFFVIGRIFKILWHQPAGADTQGRVNPGNYTNGVFGEPIHSSLRWMMVVMPKHGYCICCPISTYSKHGLGSKSLSEADVRAHSILYAEGTQARYVAGEPRGLITKDPIGVALARDVDRIDAASRVHFGKYHTVEYNVKVMDIGQVIPKDQRKALSYFYQEFGRP